MGRGREGSSGLVGVSRQVSVIMIAREVGEEWDRRPCRSLGEGRARGCWVEQAHVTPNPDRPPSPIRWPGRTTSVNLSFRRPAKAIVFIQLAASD